MPYSLCPVHVPEDSGMPPYMSKKQISRPIFVLCTYFVLVGEMLSMYVLWGKLVVSECHLRIHSRLFLGLGLINQYCHQSNCSVCEVVYHFVDNPGGSLHTTSFQ